MKQKHKIAVLVVLVLVAGLIWSFEWRRPAPSAQTATFIQDYKPLGEENPQIHWAVLGRAQGTEYKSNGRDPFSTKAAPPPEDPNKPKDPIVPVTLPVYVPPPPPTRASFPANLKYFGYGTVPNGTPRRAFITDGDDVYIVSEGDTLLGRYRIMKVGNTSLDFQEISSGLPGSTQLDEQAAPPSA